MDDIQQNRSNALDEARRKDQERQQPSLGYQQAMRDAEIQNQKRLQPNSGYQRNLENARKKDKERQQPSSYKIKNPDSKKLAFKKAITPTGIFAALKQISLLKDMPFVCALGAAILKDLLDLGTFETVILPIVFSILCSIFIFMMMMLAKSLEERKEASRFVTKHLVKWGKYLVVVFGGTADAFPGLDTLPIETITVCIVYILVLFERANAESIEKENARN